jgi:hypothetical protein
MKNDMNNVEAINRELETIRGEHRGFAWPSSEDERRAILQEFVDGKRSLTQLPRHSYRESELVRVILEVKRELALQAADRLHRDDVSRKMLPRLAELQVLKERRDQADAEFRKFAAQLNYDSVVIGKASPGLDQRLFEECVLRTAKLVQHME